MAGGLKEAAGDVGPRLAGTLGDPRAGALRRVEDIRLEPDVLACQDGLGELLVHRIGVRPQGVEEPLDAESGLPAERVRELRRLLTVPTLVAEHLRADAAGRHGEQLRPDVDDAAEEALLALQLRLPPRHAVEGLPGQLARRPLDVPQVRREVAEL